MRESHPNILHPPCRQWRRMSGFRQLWKEIRDLYYLLPQQNSQFLPSWEDGLSRTWTGHALGSCADSAQDTALSLLRVGQQAHSTICLVKEPSAAPLHSWAQHFFFPVLCPKDFLVPTSMLLCSACPPTLKLLRGLGADICMDGCREAKALQTDNDWLPLPVTCNC